MIVRHGSISPPGPSTAKLKGATFDKRTQKYKALITVNGVRSLLGTFDTEKQASDAYLAAKAVMKDEQYRNNRAPRSAADQEHSSNSASPLLCQHPEFIGVFREEGALLWEAVISVDGKSISGGEYETAEEAARA
jgi:hypothetical protein